MRKLLINGCVLSAAFSPYLLAAEPSLDPLRHSDFSFSETNEIALRESVDENDFQEDVFFWDESLIAQSENPSMNPPSGTNLQAKPAISSPQALKSRVQLGGSYTRVALKPHEHTTFEGNLGGAQGLYEYRPMNDLYAGVKLTWREGDTHGPAGKRTLLYIDAQERIGYTLAFDHDDWLLTFFSGLGYRHYGQKFDPKHGSSIKFRYNELYFPVGVVGDYAVNTWFAVGLAFTWMPQIYPTVKIVPLKGARWIIENQLANFYVEMPLTFTLTNSKRFSLIINPFYEYWRDGHSTAKAPNGTKLGLPGNTYNFGGVDVNFVYSF